MRKSNYNISKKESLSNFTSSVSGYGHKVVTYTSPTTFKQWTKTMQSGGNDLYTDVFEKEYPTQQNFNDLKRFLKE